MSKNKIVFGSFDEVEEDISIGQCSNIDCNINVGNVTNRMWWIEHISELIQGIQYEITKLKEKRSHIDVRTSGAVAATLTTRIELLNRNLDVMQKHLDEFTTKQEDQHPKDSLEGKKETMTSKKSEKDPAGLSAWSESLQEQRENIFDLKSDSSSENEIEIQEINVDNKLSGGKSVRERLCEKIEAAFFDSDSNDDYSSQDNDCSFDTNIEGLADQLRNTLLESDEELMEKEGSKSEA